MTKRASGKVTAKPPSDYLVLKSLYLAIELTSIRFDGCNKTLAWLHSVQLEGI